MVQLLALLFIFGIILQGSVMVQTGMMEKKVIATEEFFNDWKDLE